MTMLVGLNGAGRIGRCLLRLLADDPLVTIQAVNDVAPVESICHLMRHDSIHGSFDGACSARDGTLTVGARDIPYSRVSEPEAIPWDEAGVGLVVEATGRFTRADQARRHLRGPVRRVLVTAVSDGADQTVVPGPHRGGVNPEARVVSTASCTTHAAAVPLTLLDEWFTVTAAEMTTVHCTTGSQVTIDQPHADARRARSALLSMIPTTTSASRGIVAVLPQLEGRLTCLAIRVPTATVSLVECVVQTGRDLPPVDEIADRLRESARGPYGRFLGVSDEPLVSIDFRGDPRSSVVDLPLLASPGPRMLRLVAWYDNEWGYASRVADVLREWSKEDER